MNVPIMAVQLDYWIRGELMIDTVLNQFQIGSDWKSTDLGNAGGFSGSTIWKIETSAAGDFCLKRWPGSFQDADRLQWIHQVLVFAYANGCQEIVRPISSKSGQLFVSDRKQFWELMPWAKGQIGDANDWTHAQIQSAIESVARFHQATARFFLNFTPSNNLNLICKLLLTIQQSIDEITIDYETNLNEQDAWNQFRFLAPPLALDIARFLLPFSQSPLPVQPVIRDIRPNHFYFENEKVVSIIDFGAMRIDSISCDLARLFGGLFGDDARRFQQWIDCYSEIRQLSHREREIILPMNHANVILSIINWMKWIHVQKIPFDSMANVHLRLRQLFDRFQKMV